MRADRLLAHSRRPTEQSDENIQHDEDEVLAIADDDAGLLLLIEQVDAICRKIEPHRWGIYKKDGLVFHFQVIEPIEFAGVRLKMYVQRKPEWKKHPMPRSSKLYKCASVALGRRAERKDNIVYGLWLNHLFRCEVRPAQSEDGELYSVIHKLIERIA